MVQLFQTWFSKKNSIFEHIYKYTYLENIDVSDTEETFILKGEIESNILNTPYKDPTINHRLDTTMNPIGILTTPGDVVVQDPIVNHRIHHFLYPIFPKSLKLL